LRFGTRRGTAPIEALAAELAGTMPTAKLRSLPPVFAILSVRVTLPPVNRLSESEVGDTETSGGISP
jgi:hypothetical protein